MKAIITANGRVDGKPAALLRLCGLTLLQRSVYTLRKAGVNVSFIICGCNYDIISNYIKKTKLDANFNLTLLKDIEDARLEGEHFLVVDVNVIFEPDIIKELIGKANGSLIACIDSSPEYMEINIDSPEEPQDIGIFLCDRIGLSTLKGFNSPDCWSVLPKQAMNGSNLTTSDVSGKFWYRIETSYELKKAKSIFLEKNLYHPGYGDIVALFVRRFATKFVARCLIRTPVTPNQVTLLALLSFVISAVLLSFGQHKYDMIAGMLVLLALILDQADGIIARVKLSTSKFGGYLDAISDVIGYYSVIIGATVGLYVHTEHSLIWLMGMFLLFLRIIGIHNRQASESILKVDTDYVISIVPSFRKSSLLRRLYNFYKKMLPKYFDWGVALLLISIGAFLSKVWIIFLIFIIRDAALMIVKLFVNIKNRDMFQ